MRAGKLDRRIQLLRRTENGRDSHNAPIFQWIIVRGLQAKVAAAGGAESQGSGQQFAQRTKVFETRWFTPNPVATDVIRFDGNLYDVELVEEVDRRRGLKITATWREGQVL